MKGQTGGAGRMSDVKVTDLKRYLATLSEVELRGEITELFKLFPVVKECYKVRLAPVFNADCRSISTFLGITDIFLVAGLFQ